MHKIILTLAFITVSSAQQLTGDGTYYEANGNFGSCGKPIGVNDAICAVSPATMIQFGVGHAWK